MGIQINNPGIYKIKYLYFLVKNVMVMLKKKSQIKNADEIIGNESIVFRKEK